MNERIRQLALQAGFNPPNNLVEGQNGPGVVTEKDKLAKFAELIVRECARVCLSQRDPANLNYKPSERFAEAVKQHFGVQ